MAHVEVVQDHPPSKELLDEIKQVQAKKLEYSWVERAQDGSETTG